jgi:hypothetical protein
MVMIFFEAVDLYFAPLMLAREAKWLAADPSASPPSLSYQLAYIESELIREKLPDMPTESDRAKRLG